MGNKRVELSVCVKNVEGNSDVCVIKYPAKDVLSKKPSINIPRNLCMTTVTEVSPVVTSAVHMYFNKNCELQYPVNIDVFFKDERFEITLLQELQNADLYMLEDSLAQVLSTMHMSTCKIVDSEVLLERQIQAEVEARSDVMRMQLDCGDEYSLINCETLIDIGELIIRG